MVSLRSFDRVLIAYVCRSAATGTADQRWRRCWKTHHGAEWTRGRGGAGGHARCGCLNLGLAQQAAYIPCGYKVMMQCMCMCQGKDAGQSELHRVQIPMHGHKRIAPSFSVVRMWMGDSRARCAVRGRAGVRELAQIHRVRTTGIPACLRRPVVHNASIRRFVVNTAV